MLPRVNSPEWIRRAFEDSVRPCPAALPVVEWLEEVRKKPSLFTEKVPLAEVMRHRHGDPAVTDERIWDCVACIHSVLHEREVKSWHQPLMYCQQELLCGLLVRDKGGVQEWLLQAVEEPGIIHAFQLGPTLQTDPPFSNPAHRAQPYHSFFDGKKKGAQILNVVQSEEGGRFFRDRKRYVALRLPDDARVEPHRFHRWVPVSEIKRAIAVENVFNMFARTFISILL